MDTVDGNKKPHSGSQFEFGSLKLAKKTSLVHAHSEASILFPGEAFVSSLST